MTVGGDVDPPRPTMAAWMEASAVNEAPTNTTPEPSARTWRISVRARTESIDPPRHRVVGREMVEAVEAEGEDDTPIGEHGVARFTEHPRWQGHVARAVIDRHGLTAWPPRRREVMEARPVGAVGAEPQTVVEVPLGLDDGLAGSTGDDLDVGDPRLSPSRRRRRPPPSGGSNPTACPDGPRPPTPTTARRGRGGATTRSRCPTPRPGDDRHRWGRPPGR